MRIAPFEKKQAISIRRNFWPPKKFAHFHKVVQLLLVFLQYVETEGQLPERGQLYCCVAPFFRGTVATAVNE